MTQLISLPPEWAEQDAVLITWPHKRSAWKEMLSDVEPTYLELTTQLSHYQDIIIQLDDSVDLDVLVHKLTSEEANLSRVHFVMANSDDTWARDHGPISVIFDDQPQCLNFHFNGWGGKFESTKDNQLNSALAELDVLNNVKSIDWVLEGGSIESDGQGTVLTTTKCLLNPNRNGDVSKQTITDHLQIWFGAQQIIWLEHGELEGDDTDAHIDTLARFAPNNTLIFQGCSDITDTHYEALNAMAKALSVAKNTKGNPYTLIELPMPKPIFNEHQERLPATYANFLITNKLVLVPIYQDESDAIALKLIGDCFKNHIVKGIDARPLIQQGGSLHCITMQLPKGTVNFDAKFENPMSSMC